MITLKLVLLIVAFVLFVLAAFNQPPGSRINAVALGLAFWVLSLLVA